MDLNKINFKKISKEEFGKLRDLFPDNEEMWDKYRKKRLEQFDINDIDVYVIEYNSSFIGEISVNYSNHDLETETIPNRRVYLEAFRIEDTYQGLGLGQQLLSFTLNDLEKNGYIEFTIGVEDDNDIAKHIYFKNGFIEEIDKGTGNIFDPNGYTLYMRSIEKNKSLNK